MWAVHILSIGNVCRMYSNGLVLMPIFLVKTAGTIGRVLNVRYDRLDILP
ncbi:MAG: hypothetical protein BWY14_01291 [Parcubacteria group bacterium ADurb.Bin192]|nr:MAG: hypothetical protein BWY14_01291 [Parcubacteria group bacterium ADurb.Bin192]